MGRLQNLIDSQNKRINANQPDQRSVQALEHWIKKVSADIDEIKSRVAALEKIAGGVKHGN